MCISVQYILSAREIKKIGPYGSYVDLGHEQPVAYTHGSRLVFGDRLLGLLQHTESLARKDSLYTGRHMFFANAA